MDKNVAKGLDPLGISEFKNNDIEKNQKHLEEKFRADARRELDREYGDDMEQSQDRGGYSRKR